MCCDEQQKQADEQQVIPKTLNKEIFQEQIQAGLTVLNHTATRAPGNTDKAIRHLLHMCDGKLCVNANMALNKSSRTEWNSNHNQRVSRLLKHLHGKKPDHHYSVPKNDGLSPSNGERHGGSPPISSGRCGLPHLKPLRWATGLKGCRRPTLLQIQRGDRMQFQLLLKFVCDTCKKIKRVSLALLSSERSGWFVRIRQCVGTDTSRHVCTGQGLVSKRIRPTQKEKSTKRHTYCSETGVHICDG